MFASKSPGSFFAETVFMSNLCRTCLQSTFGNVVISWIPSLRLSAIINGAPVVQFFQYFSLPCARAAGKNLSPLKLSDHQVPGQIQRWISQGRILSTETAIDEKSRKPHSCQNHVKAYKIWLNMSRNGSTPAILSGPWSMIHGVRTTGTKSTGALPLVGH